MRVHLPALIILSLFGSLGTAPREAFAGDDSLSNSGLRSPPLPLDGVPLDFRCAAELDPEHPLLMPQPGIDLYELRGDHAEEAEAVLSRLLCDQIWRELEGAGAHRIPSGLSLPAHARLELRLEGAEISGERIINQRIDRVVVPVVVPHWSLILQWALDFSVQFAQGGTGQTFSLRPRGGAEQADYEALRLDRLLAATTRSSFRGLPRLLADEGNLGDLLFAIVDQPPAAPVELGVPGTLDRGFWLLLSWNTEARHAAMAFVLSSEKIELPVRREFVGWFILNDPDVDTRRDALAWLLNNQDEPDTELGAVQAELTAWLLRNDPSVRMRSEAVKLISGGSGPGVRKLLLLASSDRDLRIADLAGTHLRRLQAPTASELAALSTNSVPPRLAEWTTALDGRVIASTTAIEQATLALAETLGSPASMNWLGPWIAEREKPGDDEEWVIEAWGRLADHPSKTVREIMLKRFGTEMQSLQIESWVIARIGQETEPELRARAIRLLDRPDAPGALDALLDAGKAPEAEVRAAAALALGMMSEPVSKRLLDQLATDPEGTVRRRAKTALRMWKRRDRAKRP